MRNVGLSLVVCACLVGCETSSDETGAGGTGTGASGAGGQTTSGGGSSSSGYGGAGASTSGEGGAGASTSGGAGGAGGSSSGVGGESAEAGGAVGGSPGTGGSANEGGSPGGKLPAFPEDHCVGDGTLDLNVFGDLLTDYEGKQAYVSLLEGQASDSPPLRIVTLSGTITNGAISFECLDSLHVTEWYSGLAVAVDANDNGACDSDDMGATKQYFGWQNDVYFEFSKIAEEPTFGLEPVDELAAPVGVDEGTTFCGAYFAK